MDTLDSNYSWISTLRNKSGYGLLRRAETLNDFYPAVNWMVANSSYPRYAGYRRNT